MRAAINSRRCAASGTDSGGCEMGWGGKRHWKRQRDAWLARVREVEGFNRERSRGWHGAEWMTDNPGKFAHKRGRWGLRRRLTTWFLLVSLASVGLTTMITTAAVYNAQLQIAKAFPNIVGFQFDGPWWDRPQVLVTDPRFRAANEAFRNVTRTALWAGLGAFFLSGIAAAIVTRRLTRPIIALEDAANRLERGERDVKLRVPESKDELRTVTEAFNRLVEGLERQEAWRKRVVADIAHAIVERHAARRGGMSLRAE
ncbi:MAG: HAMP domain-containing protein [Pleurocapsa sp. SU_196_0]|nr:HAMP domain-containing protein [Pleurocapsa sp. SU_196_0]